MAPDQVRDVGGSGHFKRQVLAGGLGALQCVFN